MSTQVKNIIGLIRSKLSSMNIEFPEINEVTFQNDNNQCYDAYLVACKKIINELEKYEFTDYSSITENYTQPEALAMSKGFSFSDEPNTLLFLLIIDFLLSELQMDKIQQYEMNGAVSLNSSNPNTIESKVQTIYSKHIQQGQSKNVTEQIQEIHKELKARNLLLIDRSKFNDSMTAYLNHINECYFNDMTLRKQLLQQRLLVTIQSCSLHLSDSVKQEMNSLINSYYNEIMNSLSYKVSIEDIFNQREGLLYKSDAPTSLLQCPYALIEYKLQNITNRGGIVTPGMIKQTEYRPRNTKRVVNVTVTVSSGDNKGETTVHQIKKQKRGICYDYQRGRCKFGDRCKYIHK